MDDSKDFKRLSLGLRKGSLEDGYDRSPKRSSSFSHLWSPRISRNRNNLSPRSDDESSYEIRTPRGSPRTGVLKIKQLEEIGRGASGTVVYKGKIDGAVYCIKEMGYQDSTKKEVKQLMNEIEALRKIPLNSNIVEYVGYQRIPGKIQIIMSLYCGSLYDIIQRRKKRKPRHEFTIKQIIHIVSQLFNGLAVLRVRQLMHRDLKSCNILYDGDPKQIQECMFVIADLGESKVVRKNTKVGTITGTPGWIAPEILNQTTDGYTIAADMYSAGMVLYECMTLQIPMYEYKFAGTATVNGKKPKLSMHQTSKYACLLPLYESCTEMDPEKRGTVQDAIRMISVLKEEIK